MNGNNDIVIYFNINIKTDVKENERIEKNALLLIFYCCYYNDFIIIIIITIITTIITLLFFFLHSLVFVFSFILFLFTIVIFILSICLHTFYDICPISFPFVSRIQQLYVNIAAHCCCRSRFLDYNSLPHTAASCAVFNFITPTALNIINKSFKNDYQN